jgi:hypothetical protein
VFIDLDIEDLIQDYVNDALANGSDLATYTELENLISRVDELERLVKDFDFWKADRNHSHNSTL